MGKPRSRWLTNLALVAMFSLSLLACDSTPPAPNQQQITPTLPPPHTAEEIIARAKQVFAAETAHSYAITETNTFTRSGQLVNGTPTAYEGDALRVDYKAWYQAPNLWRMQTTFASTVHQARMFDMGPPPAPPTSTILNTNDGVNFWQYYMGTKQVIVSSAYGIKPITEPNSRTDSYEQFQGITESTRDLLAYISECYTATLRGEDSIASRTAYVITLAPRCLSDPSSYYTAPRTVWLDQQDYLLLKDVIHFTDDAAGWGKAVWVKQVKFLSVTFDAPIDSAVFTFAPPADASVIDNRPLPGGLAQARQRLKFPIFVPTYVPDSLNPTPPYLFDRTSEPAFQLHYYNADYIDVVFISQGEAQKDFKQLHPTDTAITLPNSIVAYYRSGADWCNQTDSFIYWQQDGTSISILTPSSGGIYGNSSLSKEELIKVAASMSKTADLGKTAWPPYRTYAPTSNAPYTPPTPCPTPYR